MNNNLYLLPPETKLPWSSSKQTDDRFQDITLLLLLLALAIGVAIPMINVPEKTREERKQLPPQLARVVIQEQQLEQPKPEPEVVEPEPEPEKPKEEKPKPEKEPPKDPLKRAQQQAQDSGLLQFQDDLAAMRDAFDLSGINANSSLSAGDVTAVDVDRSVISQKSRRSSDGVNVSALSRDVGSVALAGIETSEVETEFAEAATEVAKEKAGIKKRTEAVRNEEDVRKIMEGNKGAIFAIYNRALRQDPSLQGKFTVKMVIDPSGVLTDLSIVFSELNNEEIEQKLLNRIRLINFGSSAVATTTLNYTFDFLPR